jgi:hypothetical protein
MHFIAVLSNLSGFEKGTKEDHRYEVELIWEGVTAIGS